MQAICPECGERFPADIAGRTMPCPHCGMLVDAAAAPPEQQSGSANPTQPAAPHKATPRDYASPTQATPVIDPAYRMPPGVGGAAGKSSPNERQLDPPLLSEDLHGEDLPPAPMESEPSLADLQPEPWASNDLAPSREASEAERPNQDKRAPQPRAAQERFLAPPDEETADVVFEEVFDEVMHEFRESPPPVETPTAPMPTPQVPTNPMPPADAPSAAAPSAAALSSSSAPPESAAPPAPSAQRFDQDDREMRWELVAESRAHRRMVKLVLVAVACVVALLATLWLLLALGPL
jgi:hypothetical protein